MDDFPVRGSALIDMSVASGDTAVWRIVGSDLPKPRSRRRTWLLQISVFALGLATTTGAGRVIWEHMSPDTIVSTRIVADGNTDAAGRAALSDVALRLAMAPERPVALQENGEALVVTARDADPAQARQHVTSLVDAILNIPTAALATSTAVTAQADTASELRASRTRLVAAIDAADARSIAMSTSLAGLARDSVAASRAAADRKPGRETLDKANAALADLQLQRLQLATKYQDTYPAVVVMDGQIKTMRAFLADETRRVEGRPVQPDPGDAVLSAERDRLRAEMAQLGDRRRDLTAQLTALDGKLTAMPVQTASIAPMATAVAPVLIVASTTSSAGEDQRLADITAVAAAGLVLSALASLLPRRRRASSLPQGLLLEQVPMRSLPSPYPYAIGHTGVVHDQDEPIRRVRQ
ncbi:hypothetical protein [Acidisphaera sp. L21]|uniref:hypothetical protein n=1 Tax=Acidisphaera sp. L21 TaxID=1641851 RepID=UPI00131EBBD8|nr:hypothetical protein [Acidisphaera sp. L21]